MPSQRSHLLSISLTPSAADLAEVKRSGSSVQVLRQSVFIFPAGIGLDQPAALGAALADHIKQNGYNEDHAIIGLCPRWVLARHKQVPPTDADALRGIINLQIERDFAASSADMSFDYLMGPTSVGQTHTPLLLVGVHTKILRQVEQLASAAGLKVDAITSTTLAAARGHTGNVVLVEHGVAGILSANNGQATGLVSCPADPDQFANADVQQQLLADISRGLLQLPGTQNDDGLTFILPESIAKADANAFADSSNERFEQVVTKQQDAAVLLAEHATATDTPIINFAASRLRPPKKSRISPTMQWVIRAAVIVLLIAGIAGYLWTDATSRRDNLQAEYDAIKDKAAELDTVRNDTMLAASWYDKRPPALDCMLELTRTFPTRGEIRVETLTLRSDMSGQIDCAAEDRETMDTYFTKMQQSDALLQINRGSVRPVGGNSTWINFPIAFKFDPKAEGGRQ